MMGRSCGGYRITRLLGEGGMGQVYLGINEHLGKKAAIKILLPVHSVRMRAESRFLQEARAAAQIDDPNIVDILDASEFPDGRFYILMPFIEGCSLEELCHRTGPLPLETAAEILLQICGGLDAAHRHGIVHRDIKPQNILIGPRQQRRHFATIVDFGIAKLLDGDLAMNVHTESKAMIGTPGYMAPEQARGVRDIDARVDVYAVGTVAYRMLTGRTPYLDETLYGLIEKQITNAPFPSPRQLRPEIPALWEQAILASLAIERGRRLASVRELAELIAQGLPGGAQLMQTLVPRLASGVAPISAERSRRIDRIEIPRHAAVTMHVPAPAPTPTPMETPVATAATSGVRSSRVNKLAIFLLALLLASGIGSVATYAAMTEAGAQQAEAEPVGTAARAQSTAPALPAPLALPAPPPAVAEIAGPADEPIVRPTPSKRAPTPPPPERPRPGTLIVRTKTWAEVFIDGKTAGYTPLSRELPPGKYTITLQKDARIEHRQVTVLPGKSEIVEEDW